MTNHFPESVLYTITSLSESFSLMPPNRTCKIYNVMTFINKTKVSNANILQIKKIPIQVCFQLLSLCGRTYMHDILSHFSISHSAPENHLVWIFYEDYQGFSLFIYFRLYFMTLRLQSMGFNNILSQLFIENLILISQLMNIYK